jgi:three-Cys-motif partner protein
MTTYRTDGTVGPWAQEKLKCLKAYLNAYTHVLLNETWCSTYYFDAFAGSGEARLRKPENNRDYGKDVPLGFIEVEEDEDFAEYIEGSPRVALDIEHPFAHYLFVEKKSAHVEKLRELKSQYGMNRDITIYSGEAADYVIVFMESVKDWRKSRAVAFLDPFGMQVPWTTISAIAEKKSIEIILNLPIGTTIQRLIKKDRSKMSKEEVDKLTSYFGSDEWERIVYDYDKSKPESLFDNYEVLTFKYDDAAERLVRWYTGRLKSLFGYAAGPKLIKNIQGAHLYYLIWAGAHPKGRQIAQHILGDQPWRNKTLQSKKGAVNRE